jgi:transcriptional regulator with XRE-family HTH domain
MVTLYLLYMTTTEPFKAIHHGRNVRRFREAKEIKQETFATMLGEGWSQKKVSQIENSEELEPALIEELAKALQIAPDAIKNLSDETIRNIIQNNYEGSNTSNTGSGSFSHNENCSINSLEKYYEAVGKIEKLYEALLKEKDEKITLLQKLLDKK